MQAKKIIKCGLFIIIIFLIVISINSYVSSVSAEEIVVNGACGSAAKIYLSNVNNFSGSFCSSGHLSIVPAFPQPGSSITWNCYGYGGGTHATCNASVTPISQACGTATKTYSHTDSGFEETFCSSVTLSATPNFPLPGSSVTWTCSESSSQQICDGTLCYSDTTTINSNCTAFRLTDEPLVNGVCGYAARSYSSTATTFDGALCLSGMLSVTPTFPAAGSSVYWSCYGTGGGNSDYCTASRSQIITPINATCGTAAKTYSYTETAFSGSFCSSGNVSSTPYFPEPGAYVSWNCYGVSGGKHATCRAYKTSLTEPLVNGVCGSAAKTYSYTATIFDGPYCSSGLILASPIFPAPGSSVSWTCYGTGGGVSPNCTASRSSLTNTTVNAACGTAAKEYSSTATAFDGSFCSSGTVLTTPVFPAAGSSVSWTCYGSNGGSSTTCTASRASTNMTVNAACGTAANDNYPSTATVLSGTLCSQGTPSTNNLYFLSGINTLSWECVVTGGTNATCTASKISTTTPINAACGTAAKEYSSTATAFDGSFCSSGTVLTTPVFPAAGSSVSWTCYGSNGGSSTTCTASRASTNTTVNAACGTAAKTYSYTETAFSGSFCSSGTVLTTPVFPAAGSSVSWMCYGSETGATSSTNSVTCTASRSSVTVVYGICGSAAKEYSSTATAFDGSFCSSGTISATPTFPAAGSSVSWMCYGSETGTTSSTNSVNCTASRLLATVCTKDDWKCDEWGICLNGTQKRNCTMTFDCPSVTSEPPSTQQTCTVLEQKCVYVYSSWSDCKDGKRTRSIISKSSDNCLSWQPILEEACTMPSCVEDKWECTNWTNCSPEGKQQRECKLLSDCNLIVNKSPETSRNCVYINPTIQTTTQNTNTSSGGSSVPAQTVIETVPEECSRAGFNNKSDCEVYLHQMRVANECLVKGIRTLEDCRNYLFQNYGRPLKCQGLTDSECETIIKDVILADFKNIITVETAKQLADSAGNTATIQNNALLVKDIQSGETTEVKVNNIPIAESVEVKLITAENKSNQETLSPVVIIFDTDGDGLPDDVEKRIGTYINKKDTDGDGIDDGEELRKGTNPLIANSQEQLILSKIEKAIVNGESLEQPKFNELAVSQNLSVQTVENFVLEETGKNVVRVQGKSKANEVITLYIYSTMPVVVTVKSDNNGNWVYDLDKTLVNGKHEIYVAINDDKGRIVESGLPKLFFIEEAKAVVMDDFIKMEDASSVTERSDDLMQLYVVAGAIFIIIFVLIFLLIKRQMTSKYE